MLLHDQLYLMEADATQSPEHRVSMQKNVMAVMRRTAAAGKLQFLRIVDQTCSYDPDKRVSCMKTAAEFAEIA